MRIPKRIIKKINKARELVDKVNNLKYEIREWEYKVEADKIIVPYNTELSTNLEEAIECHIDYGETLLDVEYEVPDYVKKNRRR